MNRALFAVRQFVSVKCSLSYSAACCQVMSNPEEIAKLYRELSLFPSLARADVGPVITSQYGGKYSNIYTGGCLFNTKIFRYLYWSVIDIDSIVFIFFCRMEPAWSGEEWECQVLSAVHCVSRWQVRGLLWSLRELHWDQRRVCKRFVILSPVDLSKFSLT